ncbi:MAG: fructose-bisphosphate aldolase [Thermoprotei archaeon]|nr:MAG: fructose-bisphosphate aldolase [Thermoprotei archaeon]
MGYGKRIRLGRVLDLESGKSIIFPIDHGGYMGPIKGIEDSWKVIELGIRCGADSILLHKGLLKRYSSELSRYAKKIGFILRVSGALYVPHETSFETIISSVEEALLLGADAVAFTLHVGGENYNDAVRLFGELIDVCDSWGVPVLGECLPTRSLGEGVEAVKIAVRVGAELGADIIKTVYAEPFEEVVDVCPVPVVIAGGSKKSSEYILRIVEKAVKAGAAGVCIGRNIFQHESPELMMKAIRAIVKDGRSAEEALELLKSK